MSAYDVVVVGASAAGLYTAEALARAGRRVAVVERKTDHTQPKRSWIVTAEIRRFLPELPDDAVVHETRVMELRAGALVTRVPLMAPDLILERTKVLGYLHERARDVGVEILVGLDVRGISSVEGGLQVTVRDRGQGTTLQLRTRDLIGADGVASFVGTRFGAGVQAAVPVVQAKVELPLDYDPDVTRVWFDRARTRFFFWLIPDTVSTGVLGWVAESASEGKGRLEDFMMEQEFRPLQYQGAMIPLHRRRRRIQWRVGPSRVLLVGDAAAHVKVTTVGGLVSGIWGAAAAAESLVQGTDYWRELRGLHRELYLHDLIRWGMDRFSEESYEKLVALMNPAMVQLLGRRNRDCMAGAVHRLILGQPRFLGLGARALFRPFRERPAPFPNEKRTVPAFLGDTSGD